MTTYHVDWDGLLKEKKVKTPKQTKVRGYVTACDKEQAKTFSQTPPQAFNFPGCIEALTAAGQ